MLHMNRQSTQDRMSLKRKTGNGNEEWNRGTETGNGNEEEGKQN